MGSEGNQVSGSEATGATASEAEEHEHRGTHRARAGSKLLATVCVSFVVFHLAMTALYLGPTPSAIRSIATAYMEPVFKQSWWVFAPDPESENKYFLVRAKKADGAMTPWFDATRCDVDSAILHHAVPDRRHLTVFQFMRHVEIDRDDLPPKAQVLLHSDAHGEDWARTLNEDLQKAGATPRQASQYVKTDRAAANLASRIAEARWGGDVAQVQVQVKTVHTRPFDQRNTSVPLKAETWTRGFTPVTAGTAEEDAVIAGVYGPEGGC